MKRFSAIACVVLVANTVLVAQTSIPIYPEPEFLQQIYAFNRNTDSLVRLEKKSSKLQTKMKLAGFAGASYEYDVDGEKSPVRFSSTQIPTFVFRSHADYSSANSYVKVDSLIRDSMNKRGMQARSMNEISDDVNNPVNTILLYSLDAKKGERILLLEASGGTFSKKKTSNKYALSFKKIKEGYYEIVIDKPLPKGEYGFINAAMGTGETTLFAFGVD